MLPTEPLEGHSFLGFFAFCCVQSHVPLGASNISLLYIRQARRTTEHGLLKFGLFIVELEFDLLIFGFVRIDIDVESIQTEHTLRI